ncbi:MAG: glycoside hydrolase [Cytophagales bacterium]|nr:glycoside hydrolase [Cytophagales bacterium]
MSKKSTLLIGTRKGLVIYDKAATDKWVFRKVEFLGLPVSISYVDALTGTWWACLDHGHWGNKLHRSFDKGATWEEVAAPKYPEGEEIKEGVPASLRYLWAMASMSNGQSSKLLIGTEPGGLFTSDNNGSTFELNRGLWDHPSRKNHWFGGGRDHPGIHSILIDPHNPDRIYVGISCAGVFETTDGGKTWNPKNKGLTADFLPDPHAEVGQDPHLLVACDSNFEVMWQQNHCGIFRSSDGGENWKNISDETGEANFGFAIAADSNNENVAWVVPAISDEIRVAIDNSLCVCRTEDGGKTWDTFRKGLPQGHSFDITYRHALDQDEETLAFGTTTGNLYLSDDHGESWNCLNNNLPMVYSVDFI